MISETEIRGLTMPKLFVSLFSACCLRLQKGWQQQQPQHRFFPAYLLQQEGISSLNVCISLPGKNSDGPCLAHGPNCGPITVSRERVHYNWPEPELQQQPEYIASRLTALPVMIDRSTGNGRWVVRGGEERDRGCRKKEEERGVIKKKKKDRQKSIDVPQRNRQTTLYHSLARSFSQSSGFKTF